MSAWSRWSSADRVSFHLLRLSISDFNRRHSCSNACRFVSTSTRSRLARSIAFTVSSSFSLAFSWNLVVVSNSSVRRSRSSFLRLNSFVVIPIWRVFSWIWEVRFSSCSFAVCTSADRLARWAARLVIFADSEACSCLVRVSDSSREVFSILSPAIDARSSSCCLRSPSIFIISFRCSSYHLRASAASASLCSDSPMTACAALTFSARLASSSCLIVTRDSRSSNSHALGNLASFF